VGGRNTAEPAETTTALRPSRARSRRSALPPNREHILISTQEHEAWHVLLACQGQLRLAPSGHVVRIEIGAALSLAAGRGFDVAEFSEMLPTAEAGLIEALRSNRVRDNGSNQASMFTECPLAALSTRMCRFRLCERLRTPAEREKRGATRRSGARWDFYTSRFPPSRALPWALSCGGSSARSASSSFLVAWWA